jgi:t-SNARE complex subunit (syntaxin)
VREEVIAGTPNLDAAVSSSRTRDDRVLSGTRVVVYVIVSFLVLAFAVLYR